MCVISLKLNAVWQKHKYFKSVYYLKVNQDFVISMISKQHYHDKWKVEVFGKKKEEEFNNGCEAMIFAESFIDANRCLGIRDQSKECQCYLKI